MHLSKPKITPDALLSLYATHGGIAIRKYTPLTGPHLEAFIERYGQVVNSRIHTPRGQVWITTTLPIYIRQELLSWSANHPDITFLRLNGQVISKAEARLYALMNPEGVLHAYT